VLADKRYWRDVWLSLVAESTRENQTRSQRHNQQGTSISEARVPQQVTDSSIGRASSFPLSEFQQRVRNTADDAIDKLKDHPGQSCRTIHPGIDHDEWMRSENEEKQRPASARRFDSSYQVVTVQPRPRGKLPTPRFQDSNLTSKFSVPDRMTGPAPRDPLGDEKLREWNRYRKLSASEIRRIALPRKTRAEVKE
jgi:hypothetical protein